MFRIWYQHSKGKRFTHITRSVKEAIGILRALDHYDRFLAEYDLFSRSYGLEILYQDEWIEWKTNGKSIKDLTGDLWQDRDWCLDCESYQTEFFNETYCGCTQNAIDLDLDL